MLLIRHYLTKLTKKAESHRNKALGKSNKCLLIPVLLLSGWLGYRRIQSYFTVPEAVFVLGGHEAREKVAADLAKEHPHLDIWVSSGSPQDYVEKIFSFRGIESDRLHLDYQAKDTVTNFTTLVDELKARNISSVYLITSDNHMTRALFVGEIVFGSRGIIIKPIAVPSQLPPEPPQKSIRDSIRAILWLTTGHTGSTLKKLR